MPGSTQNYEEMDRHCRKYLQRIILHNFSNPQILSPPEKKNHLKSNLVWYFYDSTRF